MSRKLLLIACCLAALALAACGSSSPAKSPTTGTVAQNAGSGSTASEKTTPGSGGEASEHGAEGASARSSLDACLATHGIKAPSSGDGTIQMPAGMSPAQFDEFLKSCAQKAGVTGAVKNDQPATPPASNAHKLAFQRLLQCMRSHGGSIDVGGKVDVKKLKEAEQACHSLLKGALALEHVSHSSLENVHVGKIKIGKIKLGTIHIKKLEKLGTGKSEKAEGKKT